MIEPLLISALAGKKSVRPPVWFMRQAGRYLPEYREIRSRNSMLDVIRTPDLAAEVTLQPIRRFGFDAAIIFADILNPLIGMGIELDFIAGEGPKIFNPIACSKDVERLIIPTAEENVPYTLEAIRTVANELSSSNTPVIGFAGAPFTLSSYLIRSENKDHSYLAKRFMFEEPAAWDELQTKLVAMLSDYLVAQVKAGASAIQIFDSWVGSLCPEQFRFGALPYLKTLVSNIRSKVSAPIIYFGTGTQGLFSQIRELGVNCVGVDWRVSLREANNQLGGKSPLQGNLDPVLLISGGGTLEDSVLNILEESRELSAHIFNLGHGIMPETPISNVESVVSFVKNWSYE